MGRGGGYYSLLVVSCFTRSAALNSPGVLLSNSIVSLSSPITTILISTLFQTYLFLYLFTADQMEEFSQKIYSLELSSQKKGINEENAANNTNTNTNIRSYEDLDNMRTEIYKRCCTLRLEFTAALKDFISQVYTHGQEESVESVGVTNNNNALALVPVDLIGTSTSTGTGTGDMYNNHNQNHNHNHNHTVSCQLVLSETLGEEGFVRLWILNNDGDWILLSGHSEQRNRKVWSLCNPGIDDDAPTTSEEDMLLAHVRVGFNISLAEEKVVKLHQQCGSDESSAAGKLSQVKSSLILRWWCFVSCRVVH